MNNTTTTNTVRIEKTYFLNNPNRGRTTTLVVNGTRVLEVMGIVGVRQLFKQWKESK
jgi:hypothetical protein